MKLGDWKLTPEQQWQTTQIDGTTLKMAGKDTLGIEMAPIGETLIRVPTPSGFWKRAWRRLFGPRPPPTFLVAVQRPPNTAVEILQICQVRTRDDPKAWTDLMVQFRFVPEKEKRK